MPTSVFIKYLQINHEIYHIINNTDYFSLPKCFIQNKKKGEKMQLNYQEPE